MLNKDEPSAEWLASLRERFPCEPHVDDFLSAKLMRRAGPGYTPVSLASLCCGIEDLLRAHLDAAFDISAPRWLTGGASKLQMAFNLTWQPAQSERLTTQMVLRMQPAESIVETSRLREFQLIKAFTGHVPVPSAYWVDTKGEYLPYPALVYGLAAGVTKPTSGVGGEVSGMGTNYGSRLRGLLAPQFVENLAKIHTFGWATAELSAFEVPALGTMAVERQLNWWSRVAEEDALGEIPLLSLAAQWLRANMPPVDRISLLHGDYRCGNFLFEESTGAITAWLDWELGHLGDRHEDLAWVTARPWGHAEEGTGVDLVCGLMPEGDFLNAYTAASGLTVDADTLRYYKILNTWKTAVMALFTSYRTAAGGKTHQDILVAWCIGIGAKFTEQLTEVLEEVI
ncbi:MAG: aminoglycoside phosphotransferase (APT) family kinase protein [Gammaproteobacteria bacterium]|jgi:aminoglycoside phosphotransferase (APT) family kinase protein